MNNLEQYLEIAVDVAKQAGRLLSEAGNGMRNVRSAIGRDVKLQADVDSEKLIRRVLGEKTGLPVIGEEQGGDETLLNRDEPFWVVDPLDGTYNYLRGVPVCCVSIALMRGTEFVLGVIHDFNLGETFSGGEGLGMRVNGEAIVPAWESESSKGTIQTGLTTSQNYSEDVLHEFYDQAQRFKKTRAIGSAATALAWVAAGRCDVYHETGIRLWDIAAGVALIKAGGGAARIRQLPSPSFSYDVWAGVEAMFPPER
ncbi:MAG: inositol monophosphatase family protein [Opitutales bacterium]|nr:inositol monophosphatase family protein [Opitutales bacterium]